MMGSKRHSLVKRAAFAALVAASSTPSQAAEPTWLALRTPRFGVVSQLGEQETRRWAVEFDDFIDALQQLYPAREAALPPLTIVLFRDARRFAPYRPRTADNKPADVAGYFVNRDSWSVIGMAGSSSSADTRHVVYHEAAHWFSSGMDVESPLWLEEGLAETFSTFEVRNGKGRWGTPIDVNVEYLREYGVQPLEKFLRLSHDDVLHGTPWYYPEAWAFVHFMVFGNNGADRSKLVEFVRRGRETDLDSAFTQAFGKSYDEMTRALHSYLDTGRYGIAELPVHDHGAEASMKPATPVQVQFALARLAVATSNDDLARKHTDAVVAAAPDSAAGYELLALIAEHARDADAEKTALDRAIERRSSDATVYARRGRLLLDEKAMADLPYDRFVPPTDARVAADLFARAIALQMRERTSYEGLMLALLNVNTVTEQDDAVLAAGRRALPNDGEVVVAQAAVARRRGNMTEAVRLIGSANTEPLSLPQRYRRPIGSLQSVWLFEWLSEKLTTLFSAGRFDDARALLAEQASQSALDERSQSMIEKLRASVGVAERMAAAYAAARAGKLDDAKEMYRQLANDSTVDEFMRRQAQRELDRLTQRRDAR
jgi:tetratricopeptide (TPR) repeat protein